MADTIRVHVWLASKNGHSCELYQNMLGNYVYGSDKLKRFVGKPMHLVVDYLLDRGCMVAAYESDRRVPRW